MVALLNWRPKANQAQEPGLLSGATSRAPSRMYLMCDLRTADVKFMVDGNFEDIKPLRIRLYPDEFLDTIDVEPTLHMMKVPIPMQEDAIHGGLQSDDSSDSPSRLPKDNQPIALICGYSKCNAELRCAHKSSGSDLVGLNTSWRQELQGGQQKLHGGQNRIISELHWGFKAMFTQTYELFEYPVSQLFIALPKEPDLWYNLSQFTHNFRPYFLCECDIDTKRRTHAEGKNTIHLANHEGYDLLRATELFLEYGLHFLTTLETIKIGAAVAGIMMLIMNQVLDGIEGVQKTIEFTSETFGPLLENTIIYVKGKISQENSESDAERGTAFSEQEPLEGADLRHLTSFINNNDQEHTFSNLYRTVTNEGHVKWVRQERFHKDFQRKTVQQLCEFLGQNNSKFNEQTDKIDFTITSSSKAARFSEKLALAPSRQETTIHLS
ncbi:hypothetical protein BG011_000546 [Mortierella polycephala]|uniref:Uncharacterized protein n=1 Tax=Mortierella polycephala TaxID=41804 RepID=A0A9P6PL59_9FUNG|nr:hypothetical protein BG011_000546 [Mortierella polycephala]